MEDDCLSFLGFGHFFRGEFAVKLPAGKFDRDFRRQKGGEKYQNLSQKPKIQVVYEDILDLLMVAGRNKNRFPFNGGLMLIYHGRIRKE